jgi:hypothetical protein
MLVDVRIAAGLTTMVCAIDAPPAPLTAIRRQLSQPQAAPRKAPPYLRAVIAAAAAIAIAAPFVSPGFAKALETDAGAALSEAVILLRALGITKPPPPMSKTIESALKSQLKSMSGVASVAAAQSHVPFKIVAPSGLPIDVISARVAVSVGTSYTAKTHAWTMSAPKVIFTYRRLGGRSFALTAIRLGSEIEPMSKYVFEYDALKHRRIILVRHENFAWRNGDQVMTVSEGDGISPSEIEAIRSAMRGVALPRYYSPGPAAGASNVNVILTEH